MAETSDGDVTNRHFKNVENTENISLLIKATLQFGKLCNCIIKNKGILHDAVLDEYKKSLNS